MRELQGMELTGWTIIEHTEDAAVVGRIEYSSLNGDGSIGVGWEHHDGGNRTTLFLPSSWRCEVVANVVFMRRISADEYSSDSPRHAANLYTFIKNGHR